MDEETSEEEQINSVIDNILREDFLESHQEYRKVQESKEINNSGEINMGSRRISVENREDTSRCACNHVGGNARIPGNNVQGHAITSDAAEKCVVENSARFSLRVMEALRSLQKRCDNETLASSSIVDIVNYIESNYDDDGDIYAQVRTALSQTCNQGFVLEIGFDEYYMVGPFANLTKDIDMKNSNETMHSRNTPKPGKRKRCTSCFSQRTPKRAGRYLRTRRDMTSSRISEGHYRQEPLPSITSPTSEILAERNNITTKRILTSQGSAPSVNIEMQNHSAHSSGNRHVENVERRVDMQNRSRHSTQESRRIRNVDPPLGVCNCCRRNPEICRQENCAARRLTGGSDDPRIIKGKFEDNQPGVEDNPGTENVKETLRRRPSCRINKNNYALRKRNTSGKDFCSTCRMNGNQNRKIPVTRSRFREMNAGLGKDSSYLKQWILESRRRTKKPAL
ncbi:uncharacterized protein LOC105703682 [Orussus abietinus]|uniref:uncharacterized protein LOC105703682 n=1 Tax=Orussus abietinus TaxID=222816 RepID=UPI0006268E0A|nr:uncharacterized protein LOC105703682 [Orussus abietinus]